MDEKTLQWARDEADRLEAGQGFRSVSAAAEFIRLHGGGEFYEHAKAAADEAAQKARSGYDDGRERSEMVRILRAWIAFDEAGMAQSLPFEAAARVEAATDLMEQVQRLLDDPNVHEAAPVVLAGAALEEFLRSMTYSCSVTISGAPSLSKYASELRKCGKLSATDEKDITAWAAQRNEAAHGRFDDLSRLRAKIMVDGINFFMRQKSPASTV